MTENLCRSLLYKILEGIQTTERPRTLGEFLRESPPVRRSNPVVSLQQVLTQKLTFIQFHSAHHLQSETCEEKESETIDLADQNLLFAEQIPK